MADHMIETKLRITNYYEHPGDSNYTIFHYFTEEQSETFRHYLKEEKIPFEFDLEKGQKTIYMFAIHKIHYKKSVRLNFLTLGKHRDKFIPDPLLRWGVIIFVLIIIALAIVGYIKSNS